MLRNQSQSFLFENAGAIQFVLTLRVMQVANWLLLVTNLPLITIGYYWLILITISYYWLQMVATGYYWLLLAITGYSPPPPQQSTESVTVYSTD